MIPLLQICAMANAARHRAKFPQSGTGRPGRGQNERALAVLARDAALARIGRARVFMLVLAVGLSALLAMLASALLPGKSLASKRVAARTAVRPARSGPIPRRTEAVAPRMPAPAGPGQLGLQGPSQAPQSVAPPPVQSAPPAQSSPPVQSAPAPATSGGGAVVSGGS